MLCEIETLRTTANKITMHHIILILIQIFCCYGYNHVCVYNKRASTRSGTWNYCPQVDYIPKSCSHIIYTSSKISFHEGTKGYKVIEDEVDQGVCGYKAVGVSL